jgi:hypothetical protein
LRNSLLAFSEVFSFPKNSTLRGHICSIATTCPNSFAKSKPTFSETAQIISEGVVQYPAVYFTSEYENSIVIYSERFFTSTSPLSRSIKSEMIFQSRERVSSGSRLICMSPILFFRFVFLTLIVFSPYE